MEKTMKLNELIRLQDEEDQDIYIEYSEGCEPDDDMIELNIISLDNNQCTRYCWVPLAMKAQLEAERETALTGRYHDYTSEYCLNWSPNQFKFDSAEEAKAEAEEAISELRKEYPAILSGNIIIENNGVFDSECYKYNIDWVIEELY